MKLDKTRQYVFRMGSDNQHRAYWEEGEGTWAYEFLAGGVIFDKQIFATEQDLENAVAAHGLRLDRFSIDESRSGETYSREIQQKMSKLTAMGIQPCPKHGLTSKNSDGTCEACQSIDYPDDFKGTEG